MYCIIPLVLGFIAGRTCGHGDWNDGCVCGGRRHCCRPEKHPVRERCGKRC